MNRKDKEKSRNAKIPGSITPDGTSWSQINTGRKLTEESFNNIKKNNKKLFIDCNEVTKKFVVHQRFHNSLNIYK